MVDRVTERSDGVTAERVTETDGPSTVVVERSGGGGAGLLIGLVLLIAVVIGGLYLYNQNSRENAKTDAVSDTLDKVGDAADSVGDAARNVTRP